MSKQEERMLDRIEELSNKDELQGLSGDEADELNNLCDQWNYQFN